MYLGLVKVAFKTGELLIQAAFITCSMYRLFISYYSCTFTICTPTQNKSEQHNTGHA